MPELTFLPDDLAPGDQRMLPLDFATLEIHTIRSPDHPIFDAAYARLWEEFGALNEMESADIIRGRLAWHPLFRVGDVALRYEMAAVTHGDDLIAVRDHVAIASPGPEGPAAVIHMSHVVVEPEWRRTGVSAWLRAVPIQTGRACLAAAGLPPSAPITLVAEMEHPDPTHEMRTIRLRAYERAGFRKIDPLRIDYHQPDFRSPEEIDASGGTKPVPFSLLVRRVGREAQPAMPVSEVKRVITALYTMYQTGFRASDMAPLWSALTRWPEGTHPVALIPPTSAAGLAPDI